MWLGCKDLNRYENILSSFLRPYFIRLSWPLMNNFNKTDAAFSPCRLFFLMAFPYSQIKLTYYSWCLVLSVVAVKCHPVLFTTTTCQTQFSISCLYTGCSEFANGQIRLQNDFSFPTSLPDHNLAFMGYSVGQPRFTTT